MSAIPGERIAIGGTRRSERALEERLSIRFPALSRGLRLAWSWLPSRSRLRRAMLGRLVGLTYAAANRTDFDALFSSFDPAIEFHIYGGGLMPPDLIGVQRGYDSYRNAWMQMLSAFPDIKFVPDEVVDLGDGRLLVRTHLVGHGAGSGVPVSQEVFQLFVLRRGLVIEQYDFLDRGQAFEAALSA